MEAIFPKGSKAHIDTIGSDLRITISSPTNWFVVIFMSVWLFFWGIGEIAVLSILLGGLIPVPFGIPIPDAGFGGGFGPFGLVQLFLLVWLIFWSYGGIGAARTLLKMLAGSEVIEVNPAGISIGRHIFGLGFPKDFSADQTSSLRLANKEDMRFHTRSFGRGRGALAFDHGYDTVTFGEGLKRDEAEEIIRAIGGRFSHYLKGAG